MIARTYKKLENRLIGIHVLYVEPGGSVPLAR